MKGLSGSMPMIWTEVFIVLLEMARQNRVNKTKVATNLDEYLKLFEQAEIDNNHIGFKLFKKNNKTINEY